MQIVDHQLVDGATIIDLPRLAAPSVVVVWRVPMEYRENGLFVSVKLAGEAQEVPACDHGAPEFSAELPVHADAVLAASMRDKRIMILAEIDALERNSLLNRGSREMQIWQLEDEARKYSETYGISIELILSGNIYYPQVKALDAAAKALRDQLS